jgi:hypothetical protein
MQHRSTTKPPMENIAYTDQLVKAICESESYLFG